MATTNTNLTDHLERLHDSLLLLIFNKISDVKSLGRCSVVSRRFRTLIRQVHNILVPVDCIISDQDDDNNPRAAAISDLFRLFFAKPLAALAQLLGAKKTTAYDRPVTTTTHHSPTEMLKNFDDVRVLRIELPSGELGVEDGVLLKWRAEFGSTLEKCVILGASSVSKKNDCVGTRIPCGDNGVIPDSIYTNGGLKLRIVWTISALIAASARHYLLQPIIGEHTTLDSLVLTDADGQGVLCMDRDQLEELRVKPCSVSSASKRTLVPALSMRLWYAPQLELPDGVLLKGATLVDIRPSGCELLGSKKEVSDGSWLSNAFEEPFGMAAKMLLKRRTYCLEMNSF